MKKIVLFLMSLMSFNIFADEIVIYGPGTSKWIGKKYAPIFKEKTGHDIKYIAMDGIVPKIILEQKNPKADLVVGLTDVEAKIAEQKNLLKAYDGKNFLKHYDYSYLAINYNKNKMKAAKTLSELAQYKKEILLQNPLISNTGEQAMLWSMAMYGKDWKKFWLEIKPAIKNVEAGWTEAFNKFSVDEAAMMIGYATSNIFFVQDENQKNKFDSFYLDEGAYRYNEYAALINKKNVKQAALDFLKELDSDEFQTLVSTKNYMYPLNEKMLDKSFDVVPKPQKVVELSKEQLEDSAKNMDKYKKELIEILKK